MQEHNKRPAESESKQVQTNQFEALARNMVRLFDQGTKAFTTLSERTNSNGSGPYSMASEVGEAAKSLGEIARHWVAEPSKLAAALISSMAAFCSALVRVLS